MNDWRQKLATPREVRDAFEEVLIEDDRERAERGETPLPVQHILDLHRAALKRANDAAEREATR
jgi:hypothetical protein